MKTNFLVSNCQELWIKGAKTHFAIDPFIVHVLEREGQIELYPNVEVAPLRRTTREELQKEHDYVDQKFRKYTDILVKRLDQIHNVKYGEQFWKKCLSMGFLRHVSMCYDLFQATEQNFNPEIHECQVLDSGSFQIPESFDEHRHFLQHTHFGQEQIFSVYCKLFYQDQYPTKSINYNEAIKQEGFLLLTKLKTSGIALKILRKLLQKIVTIRQPTIGIMESFFALKYLTDLIIKSRGKIQPIHLPKLTLTETNIEWSKRDQLASYEHDFDRFDQFVFSTMCYLIPKSFVENFEKFYEGYSQFFSKYNELKWIVCESWIGSETTSMALAIQKQRGIKHIANEHNYLSYPFVGNTLKYQIPLADEFLTLGWDDSSYPNIEPSASLFEWKDENSVIEKEHDVLLIIACSASKIPVICADYGEHGGYGVKSTTDADKMFLDSLGEETLASTYVRAYPQFATKNWLIWDYRNIFEYYIEKVKCYDDFSPSGKVLMSKSKLVVVAYQSTSHLESMIADIPTIFFWNKDIMHFNKEYEGIYDDLIECGICHTDPVKAGHFVNKIVDNPANWWFSKKTQLGRKLFLEKNIGNPNILTDHLFSKVVEK
jgi:putative transferase (TIGR04331 family)